MTTSTTEGGARQQAALTIQIGVEEDDAWANDELWCSHIVHASGIADGYDSIVLDTDLVGADGRQLYAAGLYFMRSGALTDRTLDQAIYMLSMTRGTFSALSGEEGPFDASVGGIPVSMVPLEMGGHALTLGDAVALLAAENDGQSGQEEGSTEKRPRARKGAYHRKRGGNIVETGVSLTMGPLTNALMARNEGAVEPSEYFKDTAVKVNTGGGFVMLDVRASEETEIDAAYREYQLNDRDRFWLDPLYTLAIEGGKTVIEGSEILKLRGYANPFASTSASTMRDAFKSISKAIGTRIAIDVTHEKRNRRKGRAKLVSSMRLQPVVNAIIDLDRYEVPGSDGNAQEVIRDFTVNLQTVDPIESLPLAKYERARGMLTTATASDFRFESIRNLSTDDRQMWSYVLRIIRSKSLSATILFETMWRNLELRTPSVSHYAHMDRSGQPLSAPLKCGGVPIDPAQAELATPEQIEQRLNNAVRKQQTRMVSKLEKMLNEKKAAGNSDAKRATAIFQDWSWHKDEVGRVTGVKIRR